MAPLRVPRTPSVSVVLPTFNERESLQRIHPRLVAALAGRDAEIVVVDDSSPDGTGELVRSLAAAAGPYRLVERPVRAGLATAVLDGFRAARGERILVMDADGSHPPETIGPLLEPLERGEAEFVLASRRAPGGASPGLSGVRRAISFGARCLAWPLTRVSDPMSGFFAFDRRVLDRSELRPVGYKIALEILVRCRPSPVKEVGFVFAERLAGHSKLNGSEVGAYVHHIGRLYTSRRTVGPRATSTR
jgi:dolichol-phosphate mannosyltransferase